jgi:hypothetical protein
MRLDADVIAWLKAAGPGYQTKANGLLRHAMLHFRSAARPEVNTAGVGNAKRQRSG